MPIISRPLLARCFTLLFALAAIVSPLRANTAGNPNDGQPFELILVLDQTSSIGSGAAEAGLNVISQYGPQITKVGIVAFGDTARSLLGGTNSAVADFGLTSQLSTATTLLQEAVEHPYTYSNANQSFYFDGGNDDEENGVDALDLAMKIVTKSSSPTRKFIYFVADGNGFDHQTVTPASVYAAMQRDGLRTWMNTPEGPNSLSGDYTTAFAESDHVIHLPFGLEWDFDLSVQFLGTNYNVSRSIVDGDPLYLEPGTYIFEAGAVNPFWNDYQLPVQIDWICTQALNRFGNFSGSAVYNYITIDNQSGNAVITITEPGLYGINVRASSSARPGLEELIWFDMFVQPIPATVSANGSTLTVGAGGFYSVSEFGWSVSLSAALTGPDLPALAYSWQCIGAVDPVTRAPISPGHLNIAPNGATAALSSTVYGEYTVVLTVTSSGSQWNQYYKNITYRVTLGHPLVSPSFDAAAAYQMNVPASSDIRVAPIYHRKPLAGGIALGASGSTLSIETPATLGAANSLVYAVGQTNNYYLHVRAGARRGACFDITANTQSTTSPGRAFTTLTLSLDGDTLAGIAPGDEIQVIPHWTLATFFPSGLGFPASASELSIKGSVLTPNTGAGINLPASASYFYYSGTANGGPGWRKAGAALTTRFDDTMLRPGVPVIVRNNLATPTTLRLSGYFHSGGHQMALRTLQSGVKQDNYVTLVAPAANIGLGFPSAGIFSGTSSLYASAPLPSTVDSVLIYNNSTSGQNKVPDEYYYYTGTASGGPGWRKVGGPVTTIHTYSVSFPTTVGCIVRKAATSAPARATWASVAAALLHYTLDSEANFDLAQGAGPSYPVTLTWPTTNGLSYQIETSSYLSSWRADAIAVTGTGSPLTRTIALGGNYFRISTGALRKAALTGTTVPAWQSGFANISLPFPLKFKANGLSDRTVDVGTITADGCLLLDNLPWNTSFFNGPYPGDMFQWCAETGGDHTRPLLSPLHTPNTLGAAGITIKPSLTVRGHAAFAVNWTNVGTGSQKNRFQAIIINRADWGGAHTGNFDIEFNYGQVQSPGVAGLCDRNWSLHSFLENITGLGSDNYFPTGLRYRGRNSEESVGNPVMPGRHVFEYRDGRLQNSDPMLQPVICFDSASGPATTSYTNVDYGYATYEPTSVLSGVTVEGNALSLGAYGNVLFNDYGYAVTQFWYVYDFQTDDFTGPFLADPNTGCFTFTAPAPGIYEIIVSMGHPAGAGTGSYYINGAYMPLIEEIDNTRYITVGFDY